MNAPLWRVYHEAINHFYWWFIARYKITGNSKKTEILTAFTKVAPASPISSFVFFIGVCQNETRSVRHAKLLVSQHADTLDS